MIPNSLKYAICVVILPVLVIGFLCNEKHNLDRNSPGSTPALDSRKTKLMTTPIIDAAKTSTTPTATNSLRRSGDGNSTITDNSGQQESVTPRNAVVTPSSSSSSSSSTMVQSDDINNEDDDDGNTLDFYDQIDTVLHSESSSGISRTYELNRPQSSGGSYFHDETTDEEEDDPLSRHNSDLIRARPRNLRMVFVGDSITRYQYLSLAYWLRYGRWFDPTTFPNNLVNAHSFHHTYHPKEDWNEFFLQSNRMLQPMELCDCVRRDETKVAIERRYFRDEQRNNTLVYINISGKSTLGHAGLYGRVNPETVFTQYPFQAGLLPEQDDDNHDNHEEHQAYSWEYSTWGDLIRYHIGPMNLGPTAYAVLNAGLHPNRFHDTLHAVALEVALEDVGIQGVWKTTSFTQEQLLTGNTNTVNEIDSIMCFTLIDCFNLKWMAGIKPNLYYDQLHFNEPVYRILNEELLHKLRLLPPKYRRMDRSVLFEVPENQEQFR